MGEQILVIGGVAGGATAAARARRISESVEITVLERGPYVSFANCGLPYYISGAIAKRSKLLLQTPEGFDARYGVKVLVDTEAVEIDRTGRRVRVRSREPEGDSATRPGFPTTSSSSPRAATPYCRPCPEPIRLMCSGFGPSPTSMGSRPTSTPRRRGPP